LTKHQLNQKKPLGWLKTPKIKMETTKYPEELTERQSEDYDFKRFDDSDSYKEDYKKALKYAKRTKGEVYTMVDGENNKTYYLKGLYYFNRFGFCVLKAIPKAKCFSVQSKDLFDKKKNPNLSLSPREIIQNPKIQKVALN